MDNEQYILLLHKRLTAQLDPTEEKSLLNWLKVDSNQLIADQIETGWNLSQHYVPTFQPNLEAGFNRFSKRLKEEETLSHKRQAPVVRMRLIRWSSAAAVALVLVSWLTWTYFSQPSTYTFATAEGVQETVSLPDGSIVVLNENSSFVYTETDSTREVQLKGEGYFQIISKPTQPFEIVTSMAEIEVMGTSFNLRAYPDEDFVEVEVEEGLVHFIDLMHENSDMMLKAKQRGRCETGLPMEKEEVQFLNSQSWRTEVLSFRKTHLSKVIKELKRHYKIDITLEDSLLNNCEITQKITVGRDLDSALQALSLALSPMDYKKISENSYRLSGGSCTGN